MNIKPYSQKSVYAIPSISRTVLAVGLTIAILFNLVIPFLGPQWGKMSPARLPQSVWNITGMLIFNTLLLLIGWSLLKGKRQAWWLATLLLLCSVLHSTFVTPPWRSLPFLSTVILLIAQFICAPLFARRSDRQAAVRGYIALALGLFNLFSGITHLILHSMPMLAGLSTHGIFIHLQQFVAILLLGYGILSVLRPVKLRQTHDSSAAYTRAHKVLSEHGTMTLGHLALGQDKHYFWSDSGESFLAYRVIKGTALVLGDPIGPVEEHQRILKAFHKYCQQQDWSLALYQASTPTVATSQRLNMSAYKIGEEALVPVTQFTLQGKKGADVRHAIARAKRDNVTVQCWHGANIPEHIFAGMKQISAQWAEDQKITQQLGFSMGRFPQDWSPELLTVVATNPDDEVLGFLTWMPMYAGNGWTLDAMRRAKTSTPGTMEFLIADSIQWARERGYGHMALGLAPFAGLARQNDAETQTRQSLVERSAAYLHQRGVLLGQYRSLYAFKAKFQPEWQDRYLVVSDRTALPQILSALAAVHGSDWRSMLLEICEQLPLAKLRRFKLNSLLKPRELAA